MKIQQETGPSRQRWRSRESSGPEGMGAQPSPEQRARHEHRTHSWPSCPWLAMLTGSADLSSARWQRSSRRHLHCQDQIESLAPSAPHQGRRPFLRAFLPRLCDHDAASPRVDPRPTLSVVRPLLPSWSGLRFHWCLSVQAGNRPAPRLDPCGRAIHRARMTSRMTPAPAHLAKTKKATTPTQVRPSNRKKMMMMQLTETTPFAH